MSKDLDNEILQEMLTPLSNQQNNSYFSQDSSYHGFYPFVFDPPPPLPEPFNVEHSSASLVAECDSDETHSQETTTKEEPPSKKPHYDESLTKTVSTREQRKITNEYIKRMEKRLNELIASNAALQEKLVQVFTENAELKSHITQLSSFLSQFIETTKENKQETTEVEEGH